MSEEAKRSFAVFDIDGTLIRWQLYHAVADALAKHGYISPEAYATIQDARMDWKNRKHAESFKDYERRLVSIYDQLLASLSVAHFMSAAEAVFEEYKDQVYTYTRNLLRNLKEQNYLLLAISGSQSEVVKLIADYYGFDDYLGSTYLHENGKFTGKTILPFLDKAKALKQLVDKHKASYRGSIAVGDSFSDVAMLKAVEMPIAFNPEQKLYEHAKRAGWKIVLERKNMVYELERVDGKYELVQTSAG